MGACCWHVRPRDRPARRNNTPGSWCQQHTSMTNPEYNMMPKMLVNKYHYSAYYKRIEVWIESNHSLLCHVNCHVNTRFWRQVSQTPHSLLMKRVVHAISRDPVSAWYQIIQLCQGGVICQVTTWFNQGCVEKLNCYSTLSIRRNCWVLHNYGIPMFEQVDMIFSGFARLMSVSLKLCPEYHWNGVYYILKKIHIMDIHPIVKIILFKINWIKKI